MKPSRVLISFLLLIGAFIQNSLFAQQAKNYTVENGAITGHSTGRYNNRPLYINNTNAFVLTGDQPIARLVKDQYLWDFYVGNRAQRKGEMVAGLMGVSVMTNNSF